MRELGKDLEAAKRDNFELREDNKEFNLDIDKYLLMINELTLINKEVEIDRFENLIDVSCGKRLRGSMRETRRPGTC